MDRLSEWPFERSPLNRSGSGLLYAQWRAPFGYCGILFLFLLHFLPTPEMARPPAGGWRGQGALFAV